jgi:glycosyltransferase involved in cell wall biosynthesis
MTMQESMVSIVIPAHNAERFLGRTIASALAQTYDPIEVIVVDDGSTDDTVGVAEAAMARDGRVKLLHNKERGVSSARNLGTSHARGELIASLDADDLWHPDKIARQVARLKTAPPQVGVVYCWPIEIDENDFVTAPPGPKSTAEGNVTLELAKGCFIDCTSTTLVRRSCIDAVGGYDATLALQAAHDWKFYLALSEICEFALVPEYLIGYRQHGTNVSRDISLNAQSAQLVMQWLFARRPDLPETVKRQCIYNMNVFLSNRALDTGRLLEALRRRAHGCGAYPFGLLDRATLVFGIRWLARAVGLRRAMLAQFGISSFARVPFNEFQPTTGPRLAD